MHRARLFSMYQQELPVLLLKPGVVVDLLERIIPTMGLPAKVVVVVVIVVPFYRLHPGKLITIRLAQEDLLSWYRTIFQHVVWLEIMGKRVYLLVRAVL